MNFKLTKPCSNCPFLKVGGIRLRRERAREIARAQIDAQGGTFPCHKTTREDGDGEDEEARPVATQRRVEVTGAVPDRSGGRADAVGESVPQDGDAADERREHRAPLRRPSPRGGPTVGRPRRRRGRAPSRRTRT